MTAIEQLPGELFAAKARAMRRMRRRRAERMLKKWAQYRPAAVEKLGWPSVSVMELVKLERDGAGARSTAPGELNLVEQQCEQFFLVLQVERAVRDMPPEWRVVVLGIYLAGKSQKRIADELQLERNRVISRLQDAQERMAFVMEQWPKRARDEGDA